MLRLRLCFIYGSVQWSGESNSKEILNPDASLPVGVDDRTSQCDQSGNAIRKELANMAKTMTLIVCARTTSRRLLLRRHYA
jgi:hypothetical protein